MVMEQVEVEVTPAQLAAELRGGLAAGQRRLEGPRREGAEAQVGREAGGALGGQGVVAARGVGVQAPSQEARESLTGRPLAARERILDLLPEPEPEPEPDSASDGRRPAATPSTGRTVAGAGSTGRRGWASQARWKGVNIR